MPTRSRSTSACAARAHARSGGRRRCIPYRVTSRGCSKSSGRGARRRRGWFYRLLRRRRRLPHTVVENPVNQPVVERFRRVEVEVRALGVADDLLQRLARTRRENLVNLRLHLLEAVEMLRGGGGRLPA